MSSQEKNVSKNVAERKFSPCAVCFGMWTCIIFSTITRVDLGIALINMVKPQDYNLSNTNEQFQVAKVHLYQWSQTKQSILHAGYPLGFISTLILGACVNRIFGIWKANIFCQIFMTISCLLTPIVTRMIGFSGLFIMRIIIGIFAGPQLSMPSEFFFMCQKNNAKTNVIIGLAYSGITFGYLLAYGLDPFLVNHTRFGWQAAFYFSGIIGVFSTIFWIALGKNYDTHQVSSKISLKDRLFGVKNKLMKIPFKPIFKSSQTYIYMLVYYGNVMIHYILSSGQTRYYTGVYEFGIVKASLFSLFPFIICFLFQIAVSFFVPYIVSSYKFKQISYQKFNTLVGFTGSAFTISGIGVSRTLNIGRTVALYTIAYSFTSVFFCGFLEGMVKLSGKYSGIFLSIIITVGSLGGLIENILVGVILDYESPHRGWSDVYVFTSTIVLYMIIPYMTWGSSETEEWAEIRPRTQEEKIEA